MPHFYSFIITFAVAFLLAVILTPFIRAVAVKKGYVAHPREDRWHQKPTAVYGGVGIFIAFAAAFLLLGPGGPLYWTLLACAAAMFLLGLVDDARELKIGRASCRERV